MSKYAWPTCTCQTCYRLTHYKGWTSGLRKDCAVLNCDAAPQVICHTIAGLSFVGHPICFEHLETFRKGGKVDIVDVRSLVTVLDVEGEVWDA